jgi:hypothetical protein
MSTRDQALPNRAGYQDHCDVSQSVERDGRGTESDELNEDVTPRRINELGDETQAEGVSPDRPGPR